jgi:prephenate dehydrogenase
MTTVAFVGFGRFGAALGELLRETGARVRAFDPRAPIAEAERASSIADLVPGADFVAIAVPVPHIGEAVLAVRPHLLPGQIVFDVGSVKVEPAAAMAALLGRDFPWVATHPMFGPVSLARGERPLRAVVCPNALHAEATAKVASLFRRIGCEVHEQDADAHDRAMALTHALAFFIAKGMIDVGAPTHLVWAPPSFQAIARTIEAVRGDAGHLFGALHRDNPYAADARRALLDALNAADRNLREANAVPMEAPALGIPDLGSASPALVETRELIDEVDREIVDLLARRALLSRRAAAAKAELGAGVRDARREAALLAARAGEAEARGLDGESVREIFEAILRFSRKLQGS